MTQRETRTDPHKTIDKVITAKGSIYTYLPDGTTQRFQRAKERLHEPMDILVYVPTFEELQKAAPENVKGTFGRNKTQLNQLLLGYIHRPGNFEEQFRPRVRIIDLDGKILSDMEDVLQAERPFISLMIGETIRYMFPVSTMPKIGYQTFDEKFEKKGKETLHHKHLGNSVVRIHYKNGRIERTKKASSSIHLR